ncbi:MAG: sugar transferase [[Eubacterium] rectale]|nr:sugar transferase [Agathobacter rectalis]
MYRKISDGWMKHWDFELIDVIMLEISLFISYFFRHHNSAFLFKSMYLRMGILLIVLNFATVLFSQNYKNIVQRLWYQELRAVFVQVTTVNLLLLLYEYIIQESYFVSRTVFLVSWGLGIMLCFCSRIAWKRVVRHRISKTKNQSKLLVISSEEKMLGTLYEIVDKDYREYEVCAIAMPDGTGKLSHADIDHDRISPEIPVIYGKDKLVEYIRQNVVDEVYIDMYSDKATLQDWVETFLGMGVTVHIGMGFLPNNLPNKFMGKIGEANVLTTTIKTAASWQLAIKRLFDMIGALIGLIIMGIAYIFVAPAIKKVSPGPAFFKQERVGKNGRIFYFYKFRSMYLDAEERKKELMEQNQMSGLMFKMENDPRIIGSEKGPGKGIGNFIRKTSIDELPQFWNVLKGDMSLVGTRPPTKGEYEQYDLKHKIRLSMKPGITGMWQASGRNNITDFDEVVKLDTEYIENWSIWLDIKLLFKTVKVVLVREGSK